MKTLTTLSLFLSILLIASPKNSSAQFNTRFKGNVKSCTIYDYSITSGTKANDPLVLALKETLTYNGRGKQVNEIIYDTKIKDSITYISTRIYDNKGREIMLKDNKGRIISKTAYSHDTNNNLIENDSINKHSTFQIINNKNGERNTMFTNFTTDGSRNKVIYHYADEGRNVEQIWYKGDGGMNYKFLLRYNKDHNIIGEIKIMPNGTRESRETFTYDADGNELTQIDSNKMYIGGLPMKKMGDKIYSRTFRYDKFDKAGNWIQQSYLIGDRFILFAKREIEYY